MGVTTSRRPAVRLVWATALQVALGAAGPGAPLLLAINGTRLAGTVLAGHVLAACGPRASFRLQLARTERTPPDASVTIDEQYVAMLGEVTARGVRLPEGEHRITVEREGYFPWDRIVVSDGKPIRLEVDLVPIPD